MIRTNQYGIPDAIVKAVVADPYSRGESDFSVTDLIGPPQIRHLKAKHEDELVEDVRESVWRLLGQGVHSVLERAGEGAVEERLFVTILPPWLDESVVVSGQVDLRKGTKMTDYKVTATYSYQLGLKPEWEQQVNLYAWLAAKNGHDITEAEIVVVLRDWMRSRADRDESYPNSPIQTIPVPLWTMDVAEEFVMSRLALHTADVVAPCSDEERWARGGFVHKPEKGRSKKYNSMTDAANAMMQKGGTVDTLEPQYVRCEGNWCGVAEFCPQFTEGD